MCQSVDHFKRPFISDIMNEIGEMESMNNHIVNAEEPTVSQINSAPWEDDMLGVDPLELRFSNSEHRQNHISSCLVELSNNTNDFIAFNIQTTSPLPYCVDPNNNIVPPHSKVSVNITLLEATQYHDRKYTEQFTVRSSKVNEDLVAKDINQDIFDKVKDVDEVDLEVVTEAPSCTLISVVSEAQLEAPSCTTLSEQPCKEENQDLLIRCIEKHFGFAGERPVAACIIYKCLLHWRSFEEERASVFYRIIQTIGQAVETQENNKVLAYWLSNASTLLILLQRDLRVSVSTGMAPQRRQSSFGVFRRKSEVIGIPQGVNLALINGSIVSGEETLGQVKAKYPVLPFKHQLWTYMEKIYGMIRDNWKIKISPLLGLCIQVPPFLGHKVFTQIFSFINVQLFNSILLKKECCTYSNGKYLEERLAQLEGWCCTTTNEYACSAWDELKHIRQAVGFLVIHHKPKITLDELMHDLCPVLSIHQLYRISTMSWDGEFGTKSVSSEVISNLRVLMTEDDNLRILMSEEANNAVSSSFLLDDDTSIPFSVDEMSKSMEQIDISDMEPPPLMRENSSFVFLLPVPPHE